MKGTEKKAEFIELRAQGMSYSKIADTLSISKSTCTAWERELQEEIATRKQERLEELYSLYGMHRQNRIERIGDTLSQIDSAIAAKDLSELSAATLLELKLKYERELSKEYIQPAEPITENSLDAILTQYIIALKKSQSGENSPAQTKAQIAAVKEILATMSAIENRDNPFSFAF